MTQKNAYAIMIVGLLMLSAAFSGCIEGTDSNIEEETDTARLIFSVTDNIKDNFSEIFVTFTQVLVHNTNLGEWITVVNDTKTVDLLALGLTGNVEVLGVADIPAGRYSQIRIIVNSSYGILLEDGLRKDFRVPSDTLRIVHAFNATAGEDTTLLVDFDLDRSITLTGHGNYVMTPVIGFVDDGTSRNTEVNFENEGIENYEEEEDEYDSEETNGESPNIPHQGTINFAVTDNITDEFSSVYVTFSRVEIHSSDKGEWITIVNETKTVDLLALGLSGDIEVLGIADVEAGHYTQIRIYVDSAYGILTDDEEVNIMVASGTLKIVRGFNISADENRTIIVDFDLERSLHLARSGRYILTPVIGYVDFGETGVEAETDVPYEFGDYNDELTEEEIDELPELLELPEFPGVDIL